MRIIVENGGEKYPRVHKTDDIVVNNLFCEKDDLTIYDNLLKEIKDTGLSKIIFGNYGWYL